MHACLAMASSKKKKKNTLWKKIRGVVGSVVAALVLPLYHHRSLALDLVADFLVMTFDTAMGFLCVCVLAFSLHSRIWGEGSMNHSPPSLFCCCFLKWRSSLPLG